MVINRIKADGYKNLENIDIELDPHMNVICGENAQGKTNLIEAIWLCSGCRSFRGTRDKDFIGFNRDSLKIELNFSDSIRAQDIYFEMSRNSIRNKTVTLNGLHYSMLSRLFGKLSCVVFTPDDLNLTKGSPDNRRTFTDLSVSQIKPTMIKSMRVYDTVLANRNSILKSMSKNPSFAESKYLEVWDEQLAKSGAVISMLRNIYCNILNKYAKSMYSALTDEKEELELCYQSTVFDNLNGRTDIQELEEEYLRKIKETVDVDMRTGYTGIGVHRDDIGIFINGLSVRDFGSQGQARSAALVMKCAHAHILKKERNEAPIMLLDDVLSELDAGRQRFILNHVEDMQVIITCCDSKFITDMTDGKVFIMKNGRTGD